MEQKIAAVLRDMGSSTNIERDENFDEWWNTIDKQEQGECLEILRARASLIFPNREDAEVRECLPWNLTPREDELSTMLDTWYPKDMSGKSFVRECLRWKVSVSNSPVQGQIMRGARKAQIHRFTEMMIDRHPGQYTGTAPDPKEELEGMIKEGHFDQLELSFVSPNLFQVRITENEGVLFSGWPLRLLGLNDEVNTKQGVYVTEISDEYPVANFEDYTAGLDPIKSMVNSASQYIETLIEIAQSNDPGSDFPTLHELVFPNFSEPLNPAATGEYRYISAAAWGFGDVQFFVQRGSIGEDGWNPDRIWVNLENPKVSKLKVAGWRSVALRFGAVKRLQIAYKKCSDSPLSMSDCRAKGVMTAELVRFEIVTSVFPGKISDDVRSTFLEMNWLKGD
jgi:hypothetical protein